MGGKAGDPVTPTANNGAVAPGIDQNACQTLDDKNKDERAKLIKKLEKKEKAGTITQQQQQALDKARGSGMTVSSASSQVPGGQGTFSASSSGVANAQCPSSFVEGGSGAQKCGLNKKTRASKAKRHEKKKEEAGVLCDKSYVHPGGGKGAHAEPKILNEMGKTSAMRGGSILLSIDWRFRSEGETVESGMPCPDCYNMLCHAAKECDIKIYICDMSKNPQPLSKENCDDPNGYQNLSTRVDGGPEPGR
jgi:hypothetical protein